MFRSLKAPVHLASVWLALALAVVGSTSASATGFYINQQSVRGLGRVDAGNVVAGDELGTIFFNPAGLARLIRETPDSDWFRMSVGSHLIIPRSDLNNRGSRAASPGTLGMPVPLGGGDAKNPVGVTPVPNFYMARPVGPNAALGIGINAPFGLATSFEPTWHGRYDSIEASLKTFNVSIVGAYRFSSGLSLGGGLDLQHARSVLETAIPNPLTPGGPVASTDGRIRTEGHNGVTPGYHAGLTFDFNEGTRVGAHYRSGMKHDISGDSAISGLGGPLASFNGSAGANVELRLPAIASGGVRQRLSERLVLLGEVQWFNWSTFDEVRIEFADGRPDAVRASNYRDAYAVSAGAEWTLSPLWTARGGVRHDTTPTVDEFRDTTVPDSDRLWFGLGTSVRLSNRLKMDLAFNHVLFDDTSIALTRTYFDGTPLASAVRIDSDVSTIVNTVAVDFGFTF